MRSIRIAEGPQWLLAEADEPKLAKGDALVAVEAIGLNRGDLRIAGTMKPGFAPGWDFAGTILDGTAIGGGGQAIVPGTRVAGLLPKMGAWAERIAAPIDCFATIPPSVSLATAAALPSAGLTALYALEEAGDLIGRRVLVTGASGGVGHIACQLARIGGAEVTGLVRSDDGAALLSGLGIDRIAIGDGAAAAQGHGPFDLILESVGGDVLTGAIELLAPRGLCIAFGVTGGREARIDAFALYQQQRRLAGFGLFPAIARGKSVRAGMSRLLRLAAEGRLEVHLGEQADWEAIAQVAERLRERAFGGKAVLRVG